jgi:hypothetical protein
MNGVSLNTNISRTTVNPHPKIKTAGCPHGIPAGACPVCSGMGGGGGGSSIRKKEKIPGLMNWNEAFAEWSRLKRIDQRNQDNLALSETSRLNNLLAQRLSELAIFNKVLNFFNVLNSQSLTILKNIMQDIRNNVLNTLKENVTKLVESVKNFVAANIENIKNKFVQTINTIAAVADKLIAVLGEQIKVLEDIISENFKKIIKRMSKYNILNGLSKILYEKFVSMGEFFTQNLEEIKQKFSTFLNFLSEKEAREVKKRTRKSYKKKNPRQKQKRK